MASKRIATRKPNDDGPRYDVFVRNWWKHNPDWPEGREPDPDARKTRIGVRLTLKEAKQLCAEWNATHKPGPLSRKAEFMQR